MNGEQMPGQDDEVNGNVEHLHPQPVRAEGDTEDTELLKEYVETHEKAAKESREPE
jgi:hypothetical protein